MLRSSKNGLRACVIGGGYQYLKLFWDFGFEGAATVEEADLVVFTGGEDVNPALYGEIVMAKTHFSAERDEYEVGVFNRAKDLGIPMVGICRGGQFLNVMNKGKLFQHVTNHCGNHVAFVCDTQNPKIRKGRRKVMVTSTHHQMMIPSEDGIVLLTAMEALEKHSPALTYMGKDEKREDVEAVFYAATNSLCFQPHPEFPHAPAECVDIFEEFLDDWIVPMIPLRNDVKKESKIIIPPAINKKGN